jgi:hypothetical protein
MLNTLVEIRAARIPGWSGFFADHHWLLVVRGFDGEQYESCDRWEVWQHADQNDTCWGHLHKNLLKPCQGVGNGPSRSSGLWDGDDALAIIETIESSAENYPFTKKYAYWPGPNSNTFAQWVIRDKMKLGRRAVGKSYPVPVVSR